MNNWTENGKIVPPEWELIGTTENRIGRTVHIFHRPRMLRAAFRFRV